MKLKFLTWSGHKVRRRPFIVNARSVNAYIADRIDVAPLGVTPVDDDPDFFVVLNRVDDDVNLPRERTIGVVCEPSWSPNFRPDALDKRCNWVLSHDPRPFTNATEGHCLCIPWLTRKDTATPRPKRKKMSFIVAPTHHVGKGTLYSFRQNLVRQILDSDLDCDIYGEWPGEDRRLKGFLPSKADGLLDYEFSIAIENSREAGYCTEKLVDCFLAETQPVYLGDPAVTRSFGPEAVISLNSVDPMQTLQAIAEGVIEFDRNSVVEAKRRYEREINAVVQIRDVLS